MKAAKTATKTAPKTAVKAVTNPPPPAAKAPTPAPKKTVKGKGQAFGDDDDASAVYMRAGNWKPDMETIPEGKVIIPKILLATGPPRKQDAGVINANKYETIGKVDDDPSVRDKTDKTDVKDIKDASKVGLLPSNGQPIGKDQRGGLFNRRGGKGSPRSEASIRGKDSNDKNKKRKRFIRALLREDEYDDPPCCPRMGILTVVWILVIVAVVLVYIFLFQVTMTTFPDPTMEQLDNESYYYRVILMDN